ncbi:molybdate ABC transporter permease subunit [Luteolibacter yonseiensis]|uniref:Molybdenum transport system permease n=1 Tax=Luteolibacter yonseiensis TaxID=1144680 RepID=A0A934R716_9BACT|nr:molybdate ABC transporter permease subunit [Luteolibacter yonseiensis]MBK1818202.1 molybdate ABC transporter permease subunit [Luteolibacter yonseiensis]
MTAEEIQIVLFSVAMALLGTLLILPPGVALAWLLARKQWPGKSLVETFVALPLVLPPVVTGLVLLRLFGRRGPVGSWLDQTFQTDIVFTWKAVVIALSVMAIPLLVKNARAAIEEVSPELEQMARTLGAPEWRVFFFITLPLARRGILAGMLLAFARALGEFGATIMVAGNIPGATTTLSVSIYQHVQLGQDDTVWKLAAISAAIAFSVLFISEMLVKKKK